MQNNSYPTFKASPALKYFPHWHSDDGLIDAVDASIDFRSEFDELGMTIKEVAVTFFPARKMQRLKYKAHPLYSEQRSIYKDFQHSGVGSLYDTEVGWMRSGNIMPPSNLIDNTGLCLGYSPDADFAWLKHFGFKNIEHAKQALEQFAFIRECEWARDESVAPETLVKSASTRTRECEMNKIKSSIRSEETKKHNEKFEREIKQGLASGDVFCPKNVDMLMRAGWARKVLFLADRVSLVNQAKRNFKANLPNTTVASLLDNKNKDEDPTKARVIFSTYPTMLNCIDGTKKDQTDLFSTGHFDLIIIDEAHRSVYQKYGAIFDYFDSLLLGLTATPRGEVDRNTYKLFELDDHQPTFFYELERAVKDEFLVPPRAVSVPLKFQREGIKYAELSTQEQEEYELTEEFYDQETGELIEEIGSAALNKWLFNVDTVNKVLAHLMENGIKVEGGDKIGKTIIFAKSSKHAEFIVEQFDKSYPQLAGKFCRKIDYSVKYAQSLIDDFSLKNKDPQIVVSVDMLDTGIDVPEVVNLVFFKIVRSKTKFWQMVGRGTRLCPDLFLPGEDKKEFLVFDYCQNFEFFDTNPDGYESRAQESVKQKIFKRRLELVSSLDDANTEEELSGSFKNQMHAVVSQMSLDNFIVRKQRQDVETYADRKNWNSLNENDIDVLSAKISGLPSPDDDDEFARRFDLLVLNLQIALMKKSSAQESYMNKVKTLSSGLESKAAIPAVKSEMELILELQEDGWWQDVTLPMLEKVRLKLRDLVKFVDKEAGFTDVFTNFEDEIGEISNDHQLVTVDANLAEYKKRVQRFINDHKDHLTIKRLRNNEPISRTDVQALEDILFSEDGAISRDEYEAVYGDQPLGFLVRSVVGLSRKAAKEAFAEFLSDASTLHPDQITFLDEIVDYLVKNGTMEPKAIFETPFTHINDQGIAGVFSDDESKKVISLIRHINQNAKSRNGSNKSTVKVKGNK